MIDECYSKVTKLFLQRLLFVLLLCHCTGWSQKSENQPFDARFIKNTFQAKVIKVTDGDSMEVLYETTTVKIRLAHIDCPELKGSQPFGKNAKKALSDLCFDQLVTVHGDKYDRYGRLIAVIKNNKQQNVNEQLLVQGMAWHFKRYSKDEYYANLESIARKNKIGLWKDKNPIAPWEWRKQKKNSVMKPPKLKKQTVSISL